MIITLKDTTASQVASSLNDLRASRGSSALGRVLTLIVVVPDMIDVDRSIEISDAVSREHPCRVLVVVESQDARVPARLNAQIRVGGEAGASEVIVLEPRGEAATDLDTLVMPLLLSDTPVVAYWPDRPPRNPSEHPLGHIAVRRITDSRTQPCPVRTLGELAGVYHPGDTDLAWSSVTQWRAVLATIIEQFREAPTDVLVTGHATHPSSFMVTAWLRHCLGVPVRRETDRSAVTLTGVRFAFADGSEIALTRSPGSSVAHVTRAGLEPAEVNLARRSVQDCLMEELRRLDPDEFYGHLLLEDIPRLVAESGYGQGEDCGCAPTAAELSTIDEGGAASPGGRP